MNAYELICSRAWAIHEDTLDKMKALARDDRARWDSVLERMLAGEDEPAPPTALAFRGGDRPKEAFFTTVRDGVATINIEGPIFRKANLLQRICGATSSEMLARDFQWAIDNGGVHSIILAIDSPGGEVHGTNELAEAIYQARDVKPIVAYVDGMAASGAYWFASAAGEVVVQPTADLGSIGVVIGGRDDRERQRTRGVTEWKIRSSNAPRKQPDPATESGQADLRAVADATEAVFIAAVARNRGVTPETVVEKFGQGGLFVGKDAITAGLADRLGSYEQVMSELIERARERSAQRNAPRGGRVTAESGQEEVTVSKDSEDKTLREKILAALGVDTKPKSASEGDGEDEAPKGAAPAKASARQPSAPPPEPDPTVAAERDRYKAEAERLRTERRAAIPAAAETFAQSVIDSGRRTPADRAELVAAYTIAAEDDLDHPKNVEFKVGEETKTGTRVDRLRATEMARPEHGYTQRRVNQRATQAVLASGQAAPKHAIDDPDLAAKRAEAYAEQQNERNRAGLKAV